MGIKGLTKLLADHAPSAAVRRRLESYRGRVIAIDASLSIHQFIMVIRNGTEPLTNEAGEVTSHLQGMLYQTTKLLEAGIKPVFVFDGQPPDLKRNDLAKRSLKRYDATKDLSGAAEDREKHAVEKFSKRTVKDRDKHAVEKFSKRTVKDRDKYAVENSSKRTFKGTNKNNEGCKQLLRLMGVPIVQAPCEAEAQCAALCKSHKVYALASEDMASLTFGARRFLRHLMNQSYEKFLVTEFEVSKVLADLKLTMDQFIDFCILSGCDYCERIRGIGGQTALKLIREHGCMEEVLKNLDTKRYHVPKDWPYQEVRTLFKEPNVSSKIPDFVWTSPDEEGLLKFLVTENNFNPNRVKKVVERIKTAMDKFSQGRLKPSLLPVGGLSTSVTQKEAKCILDDPRQVPKSARTQALAFRFLSRSC